MLCCGMLFISSRRTPGLLSLMECVLPLVQADAGELCWSHVCCIPQVCLELSCLCPVGVC